MRPAQSAVRRSQCRRGAVASAGRVQRFWKSGAVDTWSLLPGITVQKQTGGKPLNGQKHFSGFPGRTRPVQYARMKAKHRLLIETGGPSQQDDPRCPLRNWTSGAYHLKRPQGSHAAFLSSETQGKVHGSLARAGKVKSQTPKKEKNAEKKKPPTGRAKKRILYNRRFVNATNMVGGKRRVRRWFFFYYSTACYVVARQTSNDESHRLSPSRTHCLDEPQRAE
ncbi:MAG: ribosomal protein S30-domain-containing protein [Olpidium bornovanus]|uniref:Ribosomal protein S30-domain-containing protein n=1 Tax=Olpidium bornovanus TaxID=278681 RepID=A0A8H8DE85_9FUNG|nr:MAG: ribosomal protein S30-domain-containing protein [Olpidium bornovanus]